MTKPRERRKKRAKRGGPPKTVKRGKAVGHHGQRGWCVAAVPEQRGEVSRSVDASSRLHCVEVLEHVDGAPTKHLLARDDATGCDAPNKPKNNSEEQDGLLACTFHRSQRDAGTLLEAPQHQQPKIFQR